MTARIDTRPLPIILLERWWRFPVYLGLFLFLRWAYLRPPLEGLSIEGFRSLAVFATCLVLWVFHLLPLPLTGLFALVAPPLMGVMTPKKAFSFFGSEPVFFILGVFILAAALLKSGLSNRLALWLLKKGGSSPRRLLFFVMLTSTLASFFMSAHAVAAMIFPLVMIIARPLDDLPHGPSMKPALLLSMAWGCVIGSGATMLGGGRVPLSIGILQENTGLTLTFLEWTTAVLPMVALLFFLGSWMIPLFFPSKISSVAPAQEAISRAVREQGRMTFEEKFLSLLFSVALIAWIFLGARVGMATISLLVVVLLFMFRVVEWKKLEENVQWGIVLMYGGAIGLGSIVSSTGAGDWLVQQALPYITSSWHLLALFSIVSILLTQSVSNSAVAAVLVPVGISISGPLGLDPRLVILTIAFSSGLDFSLPIGTPAIALAYSTGHLRFKKLLPPAALMILASWIIFLLIAKFWWPVVGMKI